MNKKQRETNKLQQTHNTKQQQKQTDKTRKGPSGNRFEEIFGNKEDRTR